MGRQKVGQLVYCHRMLVLMQIECVGYVYFYSQLMGATTQVPHAVTGPFGWILDTNWKQHEKEAYKWLAYQIVASTTGHT